MSKFIEIDGTHYNIDRLNALRIVEDYSYRVTKRAGLWGSYKSESFFNGWELIAVGQYTIKRSYNKSELEEIIKKITEL